MENFLNSTISNFQEQDKEEKILNTLQNQNHAPVMAGNAHIVMEIDLGQQESN